MGAYVLGGALSGLGSGINSAVTQYTKQKQLDVENALAKIKQAADVQRVNNETDRTGAEVANTAADTAYKQHQNLSPVFGEQGYNTAVQGKSAAEAQGALPARLQEMVTQGKISLDNATSLAALDNKYKIGQMNLSYGNESKLQGQQQGFQQGQLGRQQAFESDLTSQRGRQAFLNSIAEIRAKQQGQIIPHVLNWFGIGNPNPQAPSPAPQQAQPSQPSVQSAPSQNSSITPQERATLKAQGYSDPEINAYEGGH